MKTTAAIVLALSLAAPARAGNTATIHGPTGAYAGRIVQQPGSNSASVYGPTGAYQGRIVQQPDGSSQAYGPTGQYLGRTQPQQPQGGEAGQQ